MIFFFQSSPEKIYALESKDPLSAENKQKLKWLFGGAQQLDQKEIPGDFIGPRKEMITPWSTNAVEITINMGISGIQRMEAFHPKEAFTLIDPMLQAIYQGLHQEIFKIDIQPDPVRSITDIHAFSKQEGLALSGEEI